MEFPEKYIKRGRFKLHSGGTTDIFYDVNAMITELKYLYKILVEIPYCKNYIGIATGGAIIASQFDNWSMVKDGELKGKNIRGDYCLIDDVCTTEDSIKEAIKIIGKKPLFIFVVVDRRKKKTSEI